MLLAPKHLSRLAATAGLFTRYGLAGFAREQGLESLPRDAGEPEPGERETSADTARAFRERLVELGPAYIKLGQLLSSRTDLLPDEYIRELERLQDDVDPVPFEQIATIVEAELGGRISKLFETFDETPLGSASLGQAHAATLRGGRSVVVKVQRPNIRDQLGDDVAFFREFAHFLTDRTAAGKRIDLLGIITQLERALADELDYRIEARNSAHFRRALAQFPRLLTPRVIGAYSTERVLTTERIRGLKVDEVSPVTRTEVDFAPVADELIRAYLKQIVIDGYFHADPHPGNVFVILPLMENPPTPSEIVSFGDTIDGDAPRATTPLARAELRAQGEAPVEFEPIDVKIALIDFGMTARLSAGMREAAVRILFGIADGRGDEVAEALFEAGAKLEDFDRKKFVADVGEVVSRSYSLDAAGLDAGGVLYQVINAAYRDGLRPPAELALLAKALTHLGMVTRTLEPTFEPLQSIRGFMGELASKQVRTQLNSRQMYRLISESVNLAGALPHRLDLITRRLAENDFQARFDFPQITTLLEGLQKVANRVFSGLVLAGLLVASAMLLPERRLLGTGGFVIAGGLALYMVTTILLSDRRRSQTPRT